MQRKIDLFLEEFFKTQKKALLLAGARQVGKTTHTAIKPLL